MQSAAEVSNSNPRLKNCGVPILRVGMVFVGVGDYLLDFIMPGNFYSHRPGDAESVATRVPSPSRATCERYSAESA